MKFKVPHKQMELFYVIIVYSINKTIKIFYSHILCKPFKRFFPEGIFIPREEDISLFDIGVKSGLFVFRPKLSEGTGSKTLSIFLIQYIF